MPRTAWPCLVRDAKGVAGVGHPGRESYRVDADLHPFAEYLSKELGIPVKYIPVVDYAATVEALAAKKLDMVWYGGFTFVQARKRTGNAIPVVSREEDLRFHSKFITSRTPASRPWPT